MELELRKLIEQNDKDKINITESDLTQTETE